jgi:hypothetical protein
MYKVGDVVTIRSWEEMAKEYGVIAGVIPLPTYNFIEQMEDICEKVLKIEVVGTRSYNCSLNGKSLEWYITDEMISRKFDISEDLIEGDKIKRITYNNTCGLKIIHRVGNIYTFEKYGLPNMLYVKEAKSENGAISYFEFVSREYKENPKGEDMSQVNKKDFYYAVSNKEEFVFIMNSVVSLKFEIEKPIDQMLKYEWDKLFKFIRIYPNRKQVICRSNNEDNLYECSNIQEFIVKVVECSGIFKVEYYYEEFIKAMEETAIEYINGTHEYSSHKCKLCKIVGEKGYVLKGGKDKCKICPHMVINGKVCPSTGTSKNLERAKELLEWVEIYKKKLEEERCQQ